GFFFDDELRRSIDQRAEEGNNVESEGTEDEHVGLLDTGARDRQGSGGKLPSAASSGSRSRVFANGSQLAPVHRLSRCTGRAGSHDQQPRSPTQGSGVPSVVPDNPAVVELDAPTPSSSGSF